MYFLTGPNFPTPRIYNCKENDKNDDDNDDGDNDKNEFSRKKMTTVLQYQVQKKKRD